LKSFNRRVTQSYTEFHRVTQSYTELIHLTGHRIGRKFPDAIITKKTV